MDTQLTPQKHLSTDGNPHPLAPSTEQTLFRGSDVHFLIAQVLGVHRRHAQALLKELGLPPMGKKADQHKMLQVAVEHGRLTPERLAELLDYAQAWGNQRIFLFHAPGVVSERWRNAEYVKITLAAAKARHLLNSRRMIVLPETPTLSSIDLSEDRLVFTWVQAKPWFEKVGERFLDGGNRRENIYDRRETRALFTFELDLVTCSAMIRVPQLAGRPDYEKLKDDVIKWLSPFMDVGAFEVLDPSLALEGLIDQPDVTIRKAGLRDSLDGRITLVSASSKVDVFASVEAAKVKAALAGTPPRLGNFYLEPNGEFTQRLYFLVDGAEKSITVSGQQTEEEVRYVLQRIQRLSQR